MLALPLGPFIACWNPSDNNADSCKQPWTTTASIEPAETARWEEYPWSSLQKALQKHMPKHLTASKKPSDNNVNHSTWTGFPFKQPAKGLPLKRLHATTGSLQQKLAMYRTPFERSSKHDIIDNQPSAKNGVPFYMIVLSYALVSCWGFLRSPVY